MSQTGSSGFKLVSRKHKITAAKLGSGKTRDCKINSNQERQKSEAHVPAPKIWQNCVL